MLVLHDVYDYGLGAVGVCTMLHTFLPPWEILDDFPTVQKYYKVLVYFVGYVAGNARSTVYRSISINNPKGVNNGHNGI